MTEVQRNMKAIIEVVTIEENKETKDGKKKLKQEKEMIKKKNLQQQKRK